MKMAFLLSLLSSLIVGPVFATEELVVKTDKTQLSTLNSIQIEKSQTSIETSALMPTAQVIDAASSKFNDESWIVEMESLRGGRGSYYDWGLGRDGYGHCYEWNNQRQVLNGGAAQPEFLCEARRPSKHDWGMGQDGFGYCYQYTPYGVVMNQGQPRESYLCEARFPSVYRWGIGQNGYTYCYRFTPYGVVMNRGMPVPNYLCE